MMNTPWTRLQTRRAFLDSSSRTAVALALPVTAIRHRPSRRPVASDPDLLITLRDPRVQALARTALEAATQAGARYADVSVSADTSRSYNGKDDWGESVQLGLRVRALVNGYWGWASSPYLADAEAPRVGRLAVALAKASAASGIPRTVEWTPVPVVANGEWATPLTIDPFDVALEEIEDWARGLESYGPSLGEFRTREAPENRNIGFSYKRQDRLFLSTEGSTFHQRKTVVTPTITFSYRVRTATIDLVSAQAGWEYVTHAPLREQIQQAFDQIDQDLALKLPVKPIDPGKFDLVFAASAVANLLGETFGYATQVDRALGYEANAGGTSYLGPDPLTMLGTPVAAPLLTVTAERSTPHGLATIGWDDEGVAPQPFPLIQKGILVDYQTTREQAPWLAPWYEKQGRSVQSHGCAASASAQVVTQQFTPNLILQPGPTALSLEDMVQSLEHGYLVNTGTGILRMQFDFQHLNGYGIGDLIEIRKGRRVARVSQAGLLFRTPQLWNALQALGGPSSQSWWSLNSVKGEPPGAFPYSIAAVPALFTQQTIIDPRKRA